MRTFADLRTGTEPPLSNWRQPRPGEPAHGFVTALGWLNNRASIRTMLDAHGLNGLAMQPDECLAFALSHPVEDPDGLAHATPVVGPNSVTLMGQSLRRKQWSIEARRSCPACLADDPYHRAWWDIVPFVRCPYHRIDLVARDGAGRPVPWWSPSFTHAPSGLALQRFGVPRLDEPEPSLEGFVLRRLGMAEGPATPFLDGIGTLGEALDACRFMGRVALGGERSRRPVIGVTEGFDPGSVQRAGYAVLAAGEDAVYRLFRDVGERRVGAPESRRGRAAFGWINVALHIERGSPHLAGLAAILDRVVVERGQFSISTKRRWLDGEGGWLSVPALAAELGLTEPRVRRIAEILGIHEPQHGRGCERYRAFDPAQADLVRRTLGTLVGRFAAAGMLGLGRGPFDALVAAGEIKPFATFGNAGDRDRFRPEDLLAFAAGILADAAPVERVPDGYRRFGEVRRTSKTDPAAVLANVVRDGAAPRMRVGPLLADLLVKARQGDGMATARAALRAMPGIGRHDAATRFGCDPGVIDAMVSSGMLVATSWKGAWRRVDEASLDLACEGWAPAEIYREALSMAPRVNSPGKRLEALGVAVRRFDLGREGAAHVVERTSARLFLGLDKDPDAPDATGRYAFEACLLRALAADGGLKLSGRAGGLSLRSGGSDVALRVEAKAEAGRIEIGLVRADRWRGDHAGLLRLLGEDRRVRCRPEGGGPLATVAVEARGAFTAGRDEAVRRTLDALGFLLAAVSGEPTPALDVAVAA